MSLSSSVFSLSLLLFSVGIALIDVYFRCLIDSVLVLVLLSLGSVLSLLLLSLLSLTSLTLAILPLATILSVSASVVFRVENVS